MDAYSYFVGLAFGLALGAVWGMVAIRLLLCEFDYAILCFTSIGLGLAACCGLLLLGIATGTHRELYAPFSTLVGGMSGQLVSLALSTWIHRDWALYESYVGDGMFFVNGQFLPRDTRFHPWCTILRLWLEGK